MTTNWAEAFQPLIKQYKNKKHPLEYKNKYQLTVMVILSAQDSDKHINQVAPEFFKKYPTIKHLAKAKPEELHKIIGSVRNFGNKSKWLVALAQKVKDDEGIPSTMDTLTELSGIGRKSANVIIRETGGEAEGIIVDLHVVRVVPRLGIIDTDKPDKIEKELMQLVPQKMWNGLGMSISFLGREICRPTNPNCPACVMNSVCAYYKASKKK
ncbi:MAG: endonuclease III [Ignavibacteriae bacterium]|nr:endonuclease III [Ignavibacteriota bacterium]